MKVTIYVEGGGDRKDLKSKCREAFGKFFERAGFKGRMPVIVACGGRTIAHDKFCRAMQEAGANDFALLLIDSEGAVPDDETIWHFLKRQANFEQPPGATEEHAYLMVQLMESWLLADVEALTRFFGQGFTSGSLPKEKNIEKVPKDTVLSALEAATRNTKSKGQYSKSKHSFDLLATIDPGKVRSASPRHAERLLVILENKLG